jgi:hypothetical protein
VRLTHTHAKFTHTKTLSLSTSVAAPAQQASATMNWKDGAKYSGSAVSLGGWRRKISGWRRMVFGWLLPPIRRISKNPMFRLCNRWFENAKKYGACITHNLNNIPHDQCAAMVAGHGLQSAGKFSMQPGAILIPTSDRPHPRDSFTRVAPIRGFQVSCTAPSGALRGED